jgi:class 3 adenylate cyclase
MIELLRGFNEEQAAQGKVQIKIGIGIASGRVIAGYTGTQHRATYTCVGDTVNLAARIEGHTKVADRPILIDQYTYDGLSKDIEVESLGPIIFKGKQQPIQIFAVKE